MANATSMSIKIDPELKKEFSALCDELGITMSMAMNMYAKAAVREQRIPFELALDPFLSSRNRERLERNAAEMEKFGGTVHKLIEVKNETTNMDE